MTHLIYFMRTVIQLSQNSSMKCDSRKPNTDIRLTFLITHFSFLERTFLEKPM